MKKTVHNCFRCGEICGETWWVKPKTGKTRYYCGVCIENIRKEWADYGKEKKERLL